MKKVVLIGDSIRMGYDKYVKEALNGTAEVYYPSENCRFAQYVLRYAHEWKKAGEWGDHVDLVHWNAGLWDVLELFGDEPMTSIDYYGQAIKRVDKRLRMLFPKAKIVFATSTKVVEEMASKDFCRHNNIIEQYNERALEVLKDTDSIINDLYAVSKTIGKEYHSDFVHYYTDYGRETLGGAVLSVICTELNISPNQVNIKDFKPENYSAKNIGY
jgi:hypothetical protein